MNFIKLYKIPLLFAVISIAFYLSFGYDLVRSDFIKLITLYASLFFLSYKIIQISKGGFWLLVGFGLLFRLVFITAIPNLSQDFYRFLWDGRLLLEGLNPYLSTPANLSTTQGAIIPQSQILINGMGNLNAGHYSNYPPINQLCFSIAALFAGKSILGSVIVLRLIIILADIGILYCGKKILEHLKLPVHNIFWFFLNPFIIIELTGNLHFEGVMLFFLIAGMYFLLRGKWMWAALLIGISISVKLLPLLFLPLFFLWFAKNENFKKGIWKLMGFYLMVSITVFVTFLPFLSEVFLSNFLSTLALWFQNFEFNASVYYLVRWFGFQTVGYNIIGTAGKILPVIVFLFLLTITFFRKNKTPQQLITAMLFGVCFYFLLSTTVHPWYIASPLLLSVFTKYKFPIVWSFVVMLSYSAYGKVGFDEKLWLVALEYLVVIGFAVWEIFYRSKREKFFRDSIS